MEDEGIENQGFYTKNVASFPWLNFIVWPGTLSWTEVEQDTWADLKVLGDVSKWCLGENRGKLDMLPMLCPQTSAMMPIPWMEWVLYLISQLVMALHFCNLALLTQPSNPNIFSSLEVGALELADPDCSLFLLTALLSKSTLISSKDPD